MQISALKEAIAELVRGGRGLAEAEVLAAFPAGSHLPLPGPALLLSIDGLELTPDSLGGLGPGGGQAEVTLRFDFFAPRQAGDCLQSLYEALCAVLLEQGGRFGLTRIRREALIWDEMAGGYRLTARASLRGRASAGGGGAGAANISDFKLTAKAVDMTVDS